ncbi:hypothetical protein JNJ66_06995 [Candidatus Saccharibacteria bacterium]|nr:hypothetical protein [Candidatus Saccharibacteria bacterium]
MEKHLQNVALSMSDFGIPTVQATTGTFQSVLSATFVVVGALATLFLMVGGLRYITSGGDQSQIAQAKRTILYAVIGIAVAMSATAIIAFFGNTVQGTS